MFKAAEIPARKERIAELKKEKKERLAMVERKTAARTIFEQNKAINSLTTQELTTLLKYHGMEKLGDGKVPEKSEKWRKIMEKGKAAPSVIKWIVDEEVSLEKLKAEPILIIETTLGCLKQHYNQKLLVTFKVLPKRKRQPCWQRCLVLEWRRLRRR